MAFAVKDPRFPMSVVEGTFKGERTVFLCLTDQADPKDPSKGYNLTPFARLLDLEHDLEHVRGHDNEELGQGQDQKIILTGG
jgi:hypothetical protein